MFLNQFLILIAAGAGGVNPDPVFPTVQDLKDYLRIEHDAEDALLQDLLDRAEAILQNLLHNIPLSSDDFAFVDQSQDGVQFKPPTVLMTNMRPIGGLITVTDVDSVVISPDEYIVDASAGFIRARRGYSFPNGPYTIEFSAGLLYMRGYETRIVPLLCSMIIDIAADLYQRRTPAAQTESAAGTSVTWNASADVIVRIMPHIRALRKGVAVA